MRREHSAGGVVVRGGEGAREVALIRPQGRAVWALPKGHPNPGESFAVCAQREILEETGIHASLTAPLGAIRYIYQFAGTRVLKSVTFFLFEYASGEIDVIEPEMRREVERAAWLPLAEAPGLLAYRGERDVLLRAIERLEPPSPPGV